MMQLLSILQANLKDNGIDLKTDKLALQRLKEAAEKLNRTFFSSTNRD